MGFIETITSAKAASKQMAFQKEMYSNRYQITMRDMKAAGLNPMLAYSQGVGGASPQGAGFGAGGGDMLGDAIATGRKASTAVQNYKLQRAQAENVHQQVFKTGNEALIGEQEIEIAKERLMQEKMTTSVQASNLKGQIHKGAVKGSQYGKFFNWLDPAMNTLRGISTAVGAGALYKGASRPIKRYYQRNYR